MMEIIKMQPQHVAAVAQLETICFSDPWSENAVGGEVKNPLALWLVAVVDDCVVGYVGSQTVLGEADMMNIAVHPDHRRQGIAKRLVEELIEQLTNSGAYQLSLEVRASNGSAIALYQQMGFYQVGCRPRYYRNPKEDALIFRKEWSV